ncbi:hypothetical protein L2E82_25012 [Cichorium intybus]|uniref:Uncharacterized protein n=1 Tax=Cichorium intybus TaxID=13427 RepID=A0ACB9E1Z6_CICIN|nr:hypothetical protein L2E82_25012 [Cichorium intybus]
MALYTKMTRIQGIHEALALSALSRTGNGNRSHCQNREQPQSGASFVEDQYHCCDRQFPTNQPPSLLSVDHQQRLLTTSYQQSSSTASSILTKTSTCNFYLTSPGREIL